MLLTRFVLGLLFVISGTHLYAQSDTNASGNDWEFVVAPYLFMGSVSGEATIGPSGPSEVELDFGDVLKKLQFAFMARGEVYKGNWGLIVDYFYLKLGDDLEPEIGGLIDITQKQTIFETFISRRFRRDWGWFDLYGGIRYWDNKLDLDLQGFQIDRISFSEDWVDPVIGGRFIYNFSDRFSAGLGGDIGGFGIGSDFTYSLQPGLGYRFADWFSLVLQYKYLYTDYKNDKEGLDFFTYDAATSGPLLGLVFQF